MSTNGPYAVHAHDTGFDTPPVYVIHRGRFEASKTRYTDREEAQREADRLNEIAAKYEDRVHKAAPGADEFHCEVCGQRIKRVPGGQGPTWIHADSGTVAAPNPPVRAE